MSQTNVENFLGELEAGVFKEKFAHLLSDVALGTVINGGKKKGKVTVELTLSQVGENNQVIVQSKLSHITPTKRGQKAEVTVNETPFFVAKGGVMQIEPPKEEFNGQFNLSAVKN